jgi:hypothetical protein
MDKFVENLRRIASDPRNVIAANNLYDLNYIRFFTGSCLLRHSRLDVVVAVSCLCLGAHVIGTLFQPGIQNVELIPSYCGYVKATYNPTSENRLLVGLSRGVTFSSNLFDPLRRMRAPLLLPPPPHACFMITRGLT